MTIITLTTDFGHKDYSIAVIKAALLNHIPEATIIDISHQISPYNHSETAYILKNAFTAFPKGSIHIIGVESELTPENIHLAMEFEGHFFIGADNGIFSLIKEEFKAKKNSCYQHSQFCSLFFSCIRCIHSCCCTPN
jgi:S-adenosylmethionine hydrolase